MTTDEIQQLSALIDTMRLLRSEHGCDWDRAQTPETLRPYIIEEAYELVDALTNGDNEEIRAELGDLLLQVVFQAQIFSERGIFGIADIAQSINNKLQRRHPHIFSGPESDGESHDWEDIKRQELIAQGKATDFTSRLPRNFPALKMADKICHYLDKESQRSGTDRGSAKTKLAITRDWTEQSLAEAILELVDQAQKQGIDCELALRNHVLDLLPKNPELK